MKACKTRKKMKVHEVRKKIKTRKARIKMRALKKGRHVNIKDTQARKAHEQIKHVNTSGK